MFGRYPFKKAQPRSAVEGDCGQRLSNFMDNRSSGDLHIYELVVAFPLQQHVRTDEARSCAPALGKQRSKHQCPERHDHNEGLCLKDTILGRKTRTAKMSDAID